MRTRSGSRSPRRDDVPKKIAAASSRIFRCQSTRNRLSPARRSRLHTFRQCSHLYTSTRPAPCTYRRLNTAARRRPHQPRPGRPHIFSCTRSRGRRRKRRGSTSEDTACSRKTYPQIPGRTCTVPRWTRACRTSPRACRCGCTCEVHRGSYTPFQDCPQPTPSATTPPCTPGRTPRNQGC